MYLLSIGMPVYNGENFVEAALDSILNQTFTQYELIISDNGSTDKTEEICRLYCSKDSRIRYFRNEKNLGAAHNFNRVFELSAGKYFMWAAHDDKYRPDFCRRCIEVLESNPSIVLCFSKIKFIDQLGKFIKNYDHQYDTNSPSPNRRFINLVASNHIVVEIFGVIRSDFLRKTSLLGPYAASDRVLLGELALYGPFFEIPEYLFFHREHPQRSAILYRDYVLYTNWYAPGQKNVYPTLKILFELLAVIDKVPISRAEKLKCYLQMVRWFRINRWNMINDLMNASKLRLIKN